MIKVMQKRINWYSTNMRVMVAGMLACAVTLVSAQSNVPGAVVPTQAKAPGTAVEAEPQSAAARALISTYQLRSGDVISIRVFGEEDFSRDKIRLNDAGSVSFPFLGEIPVLGRTIGEIQEMLTTRLKGKYLVNPRVTAWIEEYRPFFVNGMVEKPGGYPFQPGLNIRKAVSLAGGFKERASLNKIFVTREGDSAQKAQKVDVNTEIGPGDTITVEESFF
jgi:polysaccharide biosynthesis/export protein VpsN